MRSALRKRPDGLTCAAAPLVPASPRLGHEHALATMPARACRLSVGSGR
jgi:hypothetical protein